MLGFQIIAAAYLELGTVHMTDLAEARQMLEVPMEEDFDVHLSTFQENINFLAANDDTVSPVEIIRTLTKSIKIQ